MITANVIGNLGKDAEMNTIGERQYITFRMASTVRRKGEDKTTWVSVLYRQNDNLLPYLKKGQQVYVQGDLDVNFYTSRDGSAQGDLSLFANQLVLVGQRDRQEQSAPQPQLSPQPQPQPAPQQYTNDLPF